MVYRSLDRNRKRFYSKRTRMVVVRAVKNTEVATNKRSWTILVRENVCAE